MKKLDLVKLNKTIEKLKHIKDTKFQYLLLKNKAIIKDEINTISEIAKVSSEFLEYDQKRINLAKKYAKKDESGEVIVEYNNIVLADTASFTKEFTKLRKGYKKIMEAEEAKREEVDKILEEDIEFDFVKIDFDILPDELNQEDLENLQVIIHEPKTANTGG